MQQITLKSFWKLIDNGSTKRGESLKNIHHLENVRSGTFRSEFSYPNVLQELSKYNELFPLYKNFIQEIRTLRNNLLKAKQNVQQGSNEYKIIEFGLWLIYVFQKHIDHDLPRIMNFNYDRNDPLFTHIQFIFDDINQFNNCVEMSNHLSNKSVLIVFSRTFDEYEDHVKQEQVSRTVQVIKDNMLDTYGRSLNIDIKNSQDLELEADNLSYDIVFFFGHGNQEDGFSYYHDFRGEEEERLSATRLKQLLNRDTALFLFSCSKEPYLSIINYFKYIAIPIDRISYTEHHEMFTYGFLYALALCDDIDMAIKIGKIALQFRLSGEEKFLFNKREEEEVVLL